MSLSINSCFLAHRLDKLWSIQSFSNYVLLQPLCPTMIVMIYHNPNESVTLLSGIWSISIICDLFQCSYFPKVIIILLGPMEIEDMIYIYIKKITNKQNSVIFNLWSLKAVFILSARHRFDLFRIVLLKNFKLNWVLTVWQFFIALRTIKKNACRSR